MLSTVRELKEALAMNDPFADILSISKNGRRKPVRIGSCGRRPKFEFQFQDNWTFSRSSSPGLSVAKNFGGIAFNLDLSALSKHANRRLGRLEADFAWLAIAVYLADRFAPRHPYGSNGSAYWRRNLHLSIPVSDPQRWQSASRELINALLFLTEDDWTFEFVGGRSLFNSESQDHLRLAPDSEEKWTALFSGGLDSLAGAIHQFQQSEGSGLLVSGQTHNRIAYGQKMQISELRRHFPGRVEHVGIDYGIPDKDGMDGFESSQRTRSFIHIALGVLASTMNGCQKLYLFENGFGAFNLPCDSAQIGSQNSRGTHPIFLSRMAAFVTALFSQRVIIENPYVFATKSQMLVGRSMRGFGPLLEQSFSCDRYPNYHHKAQQCGYCPSCLIRRLSLHCAGRADGSSNYSFDVLTPSRALRDSEQLPLTKLSIQAKTLEACLQSANPWSALTATWPDLLRTEIELGNFEFKQNTMSLLRRHVEEWNTFSTAISGGFLALAA